MDLVLLQNETAPFGLGSFWSEYGDSITTLGLFAGGILVYALIVNMFYQVISKRVMFAGKEVDGKVRLGGPGSGFVYLMAFPLVSFAFFLLLSAALLYLGDADASDIDVASTFTLAMAIVLAVRVAAYFSEPTSHDVAKMLPLGLLGVALVRADITTTLADRLLEIFRIFDHLELVAIYFAIVVVVEYFLRGWYVATAKARGKVAARSRAKE